MAKSKRTGKSHASGYTRYKTGNKESSNRIARLTKLAKENPNNEQLPLAIKNVAHRRNTPKAPYWSPSMIRIAKVVKQFTGKFDKNYFATDPDLYSSALRARHEKSFAQYKQPVATRSMFALKERAVWK